MPDTIKSISTNINRDSNKVIDYIVTPNAKEIFDRIFLHNYGGNRSYNLIGSYGTGKSSFLWAIEKHLKNEINFFGDYDQEKAKVNSYDFLRVIGETQSLQKSLAGLFKLRGRVTNDRIIFNLNKARSKSKKENKGLVLVLDEFGKFLEYSAQNKKMDDLYLLQLISEWANDTDHHTFFITTLHQNFLDYSQSLNNSDRLEWEKIKGRFIDLTFNEPIEQLLYFASSKLRERELPDQLSNRLHDITDLIDKSNLLGVKSLLNNELTEPLYPMDWLAAYILVNSLQRYGQNERSLFTFLNDNSRFSINKSRDDFFTIDKVYDYLTNTLPNEINSPNNPHRSQWITAFKALERAELLFEEDYSTAEGVIKSICLINIFSKAGGLFDEQFIEKYFLHTKSKSIHLIIEKLKKHGLIRFYRHSNKLNFFDGTDLDIDQELRNAEKLLPNQINIGVEINKLLTLPILLAKKYSFETGTKRFFKVQILNDLESVNSSSGPLDGYVNILLDTIPVEEINKKAKEHLDNLFVIYQNSDTITSTLRKILKYNLLIELHKDDVNGIKILKQERSFCTDKLREQVLHNLFYGSGNNWVWNPTQHKLFSITSKHELYEKLSEVSKEVYPLTPHFQNELINRHALSPPINTARKYLYRHLLNYEEDPNLGLEVNKFPPQKAIYISLLKEPGIHKKNAAFEYFELSTPNKESNLYELWQKSEAYLEQAKHQNLKLKDFYSYLEKKPFKLKRGFIEFWIPIFLIAKKEDFALFHTEGGFIPYLDEDTLDLIHKKPENFSIKVYELSGLKINLLESYKELVQLKTSDSKGTKTTFLSIYSNFLRFTKGLNNYALRTNKLSNKAISLREAIINSKDPEEALFQNFPTALGFEHQDIYKDPELLKILIQHIRESILEIRNVYDDLIRRIENNIQKSFYCNSENFEEYRDEVLSKLTGVNPDILSKSQAIFYRRLKSPLDRKSWIKSIADIALGKNIEDLKDEEEPILYANLKALTDGLIKAAEISSFNQVAANEKLIAFRFYKENGEYIDDKLVVRVNKEKKLTEARARMLKAIQGLGADSRKEILAELLKEEIEDKDE